MTRLRVLLARLLSLFGRASSEARLGEEIETHLEMLTDEFIAQGLRPDEARAAARRSFGGVEPMKEIYRAQRGLPVVDALRQDVGFGLRVLLREPLVNTVVIVTLGLGIGANTAVFSLVDALLVKHLPVEDPEGLVTINDPPDSGQTFWATYPAWEAIRELDLFDGALAWCSESLDVSGDEGLAESVEAIWVSQRFFRVLGVEAALGRSFDDPPPSKSNVAVLSDAYWKRRFGGAPDVLGRTLWIQQTPFTVVGVTPPEFFGVDVGRRFDVALPLTSMPLLPGRSASLKNPPGLRVRILGRLGPEQDRGEVIRALQSAQPAIREATVPPTWREVSRERYLKEPLEVVPAANGISSMRHRYSDPLVALMGVTGLVLLIACGNLASLMLARTSGRRRELAVRSALGASRIRLARQLLTEALLLSGAAAAVGLFLGHAASRLLVAQMTTVLEAVYVDLSLDARTLAFTTLAALGTAIVVGVTPAFRASRMGSADALAGRVEPRSTSFGPGALVVIQVAVSLMLVVGAALFLRTFVELANLDLGFEPAGLLVADVDLSRVSREPAAAVVDELCASARALPGVASVACSPAVPIGFRAGSAFIMSEQADWSDPERRAHKNWVSDGWFETFQTEIVAGRSFRAEDDAGAPLVAIVNLAFTRRFGNGSAPEAMLGQTIREDLHTKGIAEYTVVGVVEDTVYRSIREPAPPTLYVPWAQSEREHLWLDITLRASGDPSRFANPLRQALWAVEPGLPVTLRLLDEQIEATYNQERVLALLSAVFSGLALALAALGLFGTTAHIVGSKRKEISIRMALGADVGRVLRLVLGRVGALVGLGVVVGSIASLATTRLIDSLLFGPPPRELPLFLAAAGLLALAAAAATFFPARRACRIDPAGVLRED